MTLTTVARNAALLWSAALAAAVTAAALVALAGVDELVQARVVAYLEHDPHGVGRVAEILARNAGVAGLMITCGYLAGNTPRWRGPLDVLVLGTCAMFVARFAVMLGAFGWPLARHMAIYGPLEAAGFAVAAGAFMAARRRPGVTVRQLIPASLAALALLTIAAIAEARWAGVL